MPDVRQGQEETGRSSGATPQGEAGQPWALDITGPGRRLASEPQPPSRGGTEAGLPQQSPGPPHRLPGPPLPAAGRRRSPPRPVSNARLPARLGPASTEWDSSLPLPPGNWGGSALPQTPTPPRPGLTHHVQDALVVGDDDAGPVLVQCLTAFDLEAQAVYILEGPDKPTDDAAGETGPVREGRCPGVTWALRPQPGDPQPTLAGWPLTLSPPSPPRACRSCPLAGWFPLPSCPPPPSQ